MNLVLPYPVLFRRWRFLDRSKPFSQQGFWGDMRYIIVIMNPLIPQPSDNSDEEITHHLAMEVYQATQEANQ